MDKFESLSHTAWDCKYHVVFIPKYGGLQSKMRISADRGRLLQLIVDGISGEGGRRFIDIYKSNDNRFAIGDVPRTSV